MAELQQIKINLPQLSRACIFEAIILKPDELRGNKMPIYEYKCEQCGDVFEEWTRHIDDETTQECPACHGVGHRIVSNTSFVLKGGGWYVTDYGYRKGKESESKSSSTGSSTGTTPTPPATAAPAAGASAPAPTAKASSPTGPGA